MTNSLEPILLRIRQAYWRFTRSTTLGVRACVTDDVGRVLLVKHSYGTGWHMPGGGVERGETALSAVVREVQEEGGIDVIGQPVLFGFYANHAVFPNDHVALYRVEAWAPCPPASDGEILERGFFALDALPEGTTRGTKRRIAELFQGAPQDGNW